MVKPCVPPTHAVQMKENYETMKTLLEAVEYFEHSWREFESNFFAAPRQVVLQKAPVFSKLYFLF